MIVRGKNVGRWTYPYKALLDKLNRVVEYMNEEERKYNPYPVTYTLEDVGCEIWMNAMRDCGFPESYVRDVVNLTKHGNQIIDKVYKMAGII